MSKASTGFAFVAGLTIGAAGAWYYLEDKYAKLAEEEIASVTPSVRNRQRKKKPVTFPRSEPTSPRIAPIACLQISRIANRPLKLSRL